METCTSYKVLVLFSRETSFTNSQLNPRFAIIFMVNVSVVAQIDSPVASQPPDAYQIRYAAHLDIGDSVVNLTNTGTLSGSDQGRICVNVYAFDSGKTDLLLFMPGDAEWT